MNRKKNVSGRVRIWDTSTSASAMMTLPCRPPDQIHLNAASQSGDNSIACHCRRPYPAWPFPLSICPQRIAWNFRSPALGEAPAEVSLDEFRFLGFLDGSPPACRRRAALQRGFSSYQPWPSGRRNQPGHSFIAFKDGLAIAGSPQISGSFSLIRLSTRVRISVLPNFALVWPSNWASFSLTLMMAVRPSASSPDRFLSRPLRYYIFWRNVVHDSGEARLKPSSWVPPSVVWILTAKEINSSCFRYTVATSASADHR